MTNVFICMTPLQVLVAKKVMQHNKIKKINSILIYYGYEQTIIIKKYLDKYSFYFDKVIFLKLKKFPLYSFQILFLLKKIKKKEINLYLSCVNNIIHFYFLSFANAKNIYTFDDGSGDYEENGHKINVKDNNFKKIIYFFLGNRFTFNKLLKKRKVHYTINKFNLNNKKNYLFIGNIFKKKIKFKKNLKKINFFIGTVYDEFFSSENFSNDEKKNYLSSIQKFFKKKYNVYYLKHPRENSKINLFKKNKLPSNKIAEEIILDYYHKGYQINLYGFYGSTVFYNLLSFNNIKKFYFDFNKNFISKKIYKKFFEKKFNKIKIYV